MKIATLLFTYNRSFHTKQVCEALKRNSVQTEKLIVFQDGPKQDEKTEEWKKVNALIYGIDWCEKEVIVSERNKGLAESIVSGIKYAFREYDAVIVLEDDCVPMHEFVSFMKHGFERYINDKSVYCISGYSWPIPVIDSTGEDAYFCGRISSWGWGTWKDRWMQYEQDYGILSGLKKSRDGSKRLAIWGNDLEEMLVNRVRGTNDSWAVFWALNVIAQRGLCLNPYQSLIRNIGMDGTGVHCGATDKYNAYAEEGRERTYTLPRRIETLDVIEKEFSRFYQNYTVKNEKLDNKETVFVYGMGTLFFSMEREINEKFYIEGFIDANKKGYYAGRPIIKVEEISRTQFDKIVVCMTDRDEGIRCARRLIKEYDISFDEIVFAQEISDMG